MANYPQWFKNYCKKNPRVGLKKETSDDLAQRKRHKVIVDDEENGPSHSESETNPGNGSISEDPDTDMYVHEDKDKDKDKDSNIALSSRLKEDIWEESGGALRLWAWPVIRGDPLWVP